MAYTKNTWVDQDVERPKTYEVTNNQDGSITLTDSFGLVTELGTPVNAVNMNHIEDGIEDLDLLKADTDLSNLNDAGEKHFLNKNQTTNCILEAPNGVGYTDTTNYYVPSGVKVLAPNGRNQDNTLKNAELTTPYELSNALATGSSEGKRRLVFLTYLTNISITHITEENVLYVHYYNDLPSSLSNTMSYFAYVFLDNRWYYTSGSTTPNWRPIMAVPLYFYYEKNSYTTAPETFSYQSLQLLHRGNKNEISGWGMPSRGSINLTLGASGTTYTAPANGWVSFSKQGTDGQQITLYNSTSYIRVQTYQRAGTTTPAWNGIILPVKKGDSFRAEYTCTGETKDFKFIYAGGEVL